MERLVRKLGAWGPWREPKGSQHSHCSVHPSLTCFLLPSPSWTLHMLRNKPKVVHTSVSHSVVSDSCDPINCSLSGFFVHGMLQERILE